MAGTVHIEPASVDITVEDGETILHAAERLGYHWPTVCHGQAICTTCSFEVVEGSENLNGRGPLEAAALAEYLDDPYYEGREMTDFERYLELHEIDPVTLSIAAKVRYSVIWDAKKGNPITSENARKIKEAVFNLTGTPYTGSFVLIRYRAIDRLPTVRIRKIPGFRMFLRKATLYFHESL